MLRRDGGAAQSAEEAAFDRARRELVFELRGAPADRTRTAEELADLERQRLEVRIAVLRRGIAGSWSYSCQVEVASCCGCVIACRARLQDPASSTG